MTAVMFALLTVPAICLIAAIVGTTIEWMLHEQEARAYRAWLEERKAREQEWRSIVERLRDLDQHFPGV